MRRLFIIALGTAAALATAAVAIAVTITAGVSTATAGFDAAKVSVQTRSCTGEDSKAYEVTRGHYAGTMTSSIADLAGPLTINARTVYSTSDNLGYVDGSFRVKDDDSRASGRIWGTLDKDGNLVGFLDGWSWGTHARVLGNVSAAFGAGTTGFVGGKLGAGGSTAITAIIAGPVCKGKKPEHKTDDKSGHKTGDKSGHTTDHPARPLSVKGEVTAVGDGKDGSTITVRWIGPATVTCTRDATSPTTDGFPVGTKVAMKCEKAGTDWVLRELKTRA
jgi:hypothetical protein